MWTTRGKSGGLTSGFALHIVSFQFMSRLTAFSERKVVQQLCEKQHVAWK